MSLRTSLLLSWTLLGATTATWSALSWSLHRDGVTARAVWLPVDPASYYAHQAWFVGPLLVLLTVIFAAVAHGMARGNRGVHLRETWAALTPIFAGMLLIGLLVPDCITYALGGRPMMARAMRYYAPAVPLGIVLGATARLAALHGIPRGRAARITLLGLLAQALLGVLFLR